MTDLVSPTKKALLIAIEHVRGRHESRFDGLHDPVFAHRDAIDLRDKLIDSYGYHPNNIVLMMDNKNHPSYLWPTRRRIITQIDVLTKNVPESCNILFYFSGHCLEEEIPDHQHMGADGRDSEIVCADGKPILDYELHNYLVKPLENVKGSKLFALFDCSHSENMLGLQKGKEPNTCSRAWTIGAGLFEDVATVIVNLMKPKKKSGDEHHISPRPVRRTNYKLPNASTCDTLELGELSVICLSASKDGQLAHDDCERGSTLTKLFIDAMSSKPNITWEEFRDILQELVSDIRVRYEETSTQKSLLSSEMHWTQEPRLYFSSHTNLTKIVSL